MMKAQGGLEQAGQEAKLRVAALYTSCGCKSWEKCPLSTGWKGQCSQLCLIHSQGGSRHTLGPCDLELISSSNFSSVSLQIKWVQEALF